MTPTTADLIAQLHRWANDARASALGCAPGSHLTSYYRGRQLAFRVAAQFLTDDPPALALRRLHALHGGAYRTAQHATDRDVMYRAVGRHSALEQVLDAAERASARERLTTGQVSSMDAL